MTEHNAKARAAAIAYLKQREIWILGGKFTPSRGADVAQTIARYRAQTQSETLIRVVK